MRSVSRVASTAEGIPWLRPLAERRRGGGSAPREKDGEDSRENAAAGVAGSRGVGKAPGLLKKFYLAGALGLSDATERRYALVRWSATRARAPLVLPFLADTGSPCLFLRRGFRGLVVQFPSGALDEQEVAGPPRDRSVDRDMRSL